MDDRVFQRLRRRVERGERLSQAELRRLRTAADTEGGSGLSVTLGLARALVRAERLEEAERVLDEAAAAHPGELGVRKRLVLLALRRGSRATAERALTELRVVAPEDEEVRALAEALRSRSGGSALEVLLDGAWEWFGKAGAWEHGGLRATWTDERPSVVVEEMLARVLPVLTETARAGVLSRGGPAGLLVTYLSDGMAIEQERAPASLETVDRAAWKHLQDRPAEPRPVIVDRGQPRLSPEPLGLWALCEADGADGARLLTDGEQRRLLETVGVGPYRVSLARRELALVAQLEDAAGVALLESVLPGPDGIPGRFLLRSGGTLERVAS
jgi:hypothetical protein